MYFIVFFKFSKKEKKVWCYLKDYLGKVINGMECLKINLSIEVYLVYILYMIIWFFRLLINDRYFVYGVDILDYLFV